MSRPLALPLRVLVLAALAAPGALHAQPAPAPLALYVAPDLAVDRGALRESLASELGRAVALVDTAAAPGELLLVEAPADELRVTYRSGPGHRIERRLPDAPGDPVERTRMVALVAAHLARDESLEILALLAAAQPAAATAPGVGEETPAAATPTEETAPMDLDDVEAGAPATRTTEATLTEPEPPAPSASPLRLPPLRDPGPRTVSMGADLAPGLGSSTFFRGRDRRHFSLGVFGAWSGAIEGAALSGGVDVVTGNVSGAQLAGIGSYADGTVEGLQAGGAGAVVRGDLEGVQLAGGAAIAWRDLLGVQASAGLAMTRGSLRGVQNASLLALVHGDVTGMQAATVSWTGGTLRGAQVGMLNFIGEGIGAQVGLLNVSAGDVQGAQLGLVNVARGRVRGAQLGLVNVAEDADVGLGFVNVYRDSRRRLRLTADSDAVLRAELHHGSRLLRSIVTVGAPLTDERSLRAGWGLGGRLTVSPGIELTLDALVLGLFPLAEQDATPDLLTELRASVVVGVSDSVALVFGAALQTQLSWRRTPLGGVGRITRTRLDGTPPELAGTLDGQPFAFASPLLSVGLELH